MREWGNRKRQHAKRKRNEMIFFQRIFIRIHALPNREALLLYSCSQILIAHSKEMETEKCKIAVRDKQLIWMF